MLKRSRQQPKLSFLQLLLGCYSIEKSTFVIFNVGALKRSSQQSKSVILHLLLGCYNMKRNSGTISSR